MGYNTTVIVMNDALHQIAQDEKFGEKLVDAICGLSISDDTEGVRVPSRNVSAGGYVNAATAVETHHSNRNTIVAVGGNHATVIGYTFGSHHNPEDKESILRWLASELGYSLRKKAKR